MRRKPTNWKEIDIRRFQRNENTDPVGRWSMIISSGEDGACTVVSQYGGTESAWAEAYEGGESFWESFGTT